MKRAKRVTAGSKGRKPAGLTLRASAEKPTSRESRRFYGPIDLQAMYRPLKKPVTLRLDADVLAWFKKDGRRYQTRINRALRKVMEREMKAAEE